MPRTMMTYKAYKTYKGANGDLSYEDYMKFSKAAEQGYMSPGDYKKADAADNADEKARKAVSGTARGVLDAQSQTATGDQGQRGILKADQLIKAIGDYEAVEAAATEAGGDRESFLKSRLDAGTISRDEQRELGQLWAATSDDSASTGTTLRKGLTEQIEEDEDNPEASELQDASPFLKSLVNSVNDTLSAVRDDVMRDGSVTRTLLRGQGTLIKAMGGVMAEQEELIKSQGEIIDRMGARLGVLEGQPVVRKSRGTPDPRDVRQREAGGGVREGGEGAGFGDKLTKSQVFAGLEDLLKKADTANDDGAMDRLIHAIAKFESTGQIDQNILAAVQVGLGHPANA